MYDHLQQFQLRGVGLWLFLSKNTPEVSGLTTAQSGGVSLSGTYYYSVSTRLRCFFALHERHIFRSPRKVMSEQYVGTDGDPELQRGKFRIINDINTFSISGGMALSLFQSRKELHLFIRYLHGHFYGYVDSRDNRSMLSVGILLTGMQ